MEIKISKTVWIVVLIWAIVASIFGTLFAVTFNDDFSLGANENALSNVFLSFAYITTVCFLVIAVVIALAFIVYKLVIMFIDDRKSALKIVGAVVVAGLAFLVIYLTASTENISTKTAAGLSKGDIKMIGAGLTTVYILGAATIIAVIYAEVAKKLK